MTTSYVTKKLLELNEAIVNMSDEELKSFVKDADFKKGKQYDFLCEHVLGMTDTSDQLDIRSPEFLRQT